jgi:hypothetical protein
MKIARSLPETDLARVALLPDDQKRIVLRGVKSFVPPHSLSPVRQMAKALYGARAPLIADRPIAWSDIEQAIKRLCRKNPHWLEPNLSIAKTIFHFNQERAFRAIEWEFPSVPIGFGAKIKFWHDLYSIQGEQPVLAFIDPRLSDGLTSLGRLFIFSAMYHTVAIGDFDGATLEVLRLPQEKFSKKRKVEVFKFDRRDAVDELTLNNAITRTFAIWQEVLLERTEEARRRPAADGGLPF